MERKDGAEPLEARLLTRNASSALRTKSKGNDLGQPLTSDNASLQNNFNFVKGGEKG